MSLSFPLASFSERTLLCSKNSLTDHAFDPHKILQRFLLYMTSKRFPVNLYSILYIPLKYCSTPSTSKYLLGYYRCVGKIISQITDKTQSLNTTYATPSSWLTTQNDPFESQEELPALPRNRPQPFRRSRSSVLHLFQFLPQNKYCFINGFHCSSDSHWDPLRCWLHVRVFQRVYHDTVWQVSETARIKTPCVVCENLMLCQIYLP